MRGEEVNEIFITSNGVKGDRRHAFRSSANRAEFPYFTAREQRHMLRFHPRVAHDGTVSVATPDGTTLAIDDPALLAVLRDGVDPRHEVTLMRSDRALTDAAPVSLFSVQTVQKLSAETGTPWDKRRFRANIYLDVPDSDGFAEDKLVGRAIRIGSSAVISVAERDSRCMMITLDPDTAAKAPALLKTVAQLHAGNAGVYGTVLTEGPVRIGDPVHLIE